MRLWRISNFADLTGHGGTLISGRWHVIGKPVVYCCDHPSTALLEILVHATRLTVPDFYQLIAIDVPDDVRPADAQLRDGWEDDQDFTQRAGVAFLAAEETALLRMPSVIMPQARNYLLNPRHKDAPRISIVDVYRYPFDSRLFRQITS